MLAFTAYPMEALTEYKGNLTANVPVIYTLVTNPDDALLRFKLAGTGGKWLMFETTSECFAATVQLMGGTKPVFYSSSLYLYVNYR
jgi:hypothetical protein